MDELIGRLHFQDGEEIWGGMGVNITCAVDESGNSVSLSVPTNFRPDLDIKILTHGFAFKCADSDKYSAVEGKFVKSLYKRKEKATQVEKPWLPQ